MMHGPLCHLIDKDILICYCSGKVEAVSVDWNRSFEPGAVRVNYNEVIAPKPIKEGDMITIEGMHQMVPNPDRKWWQFWKPAKILGPLQRYRVLAVSEGDVLAWGPDPRYRVAPDIVM